MDVALVAADVARKRGTAESDDGTGLDMRTEAELESERLARARAKGTQQESEDEAGRYACIMHRPSLTTRADSQLAGA